MLTETLREERENRLALESFTKKEIMINADNDAQDDEAAKHGIVAVQKDVSYLEQILRAEVKAARDLLLGRPALRFETILQQKTISSD